MAGLHGYLPQYCSSHETPDDAALDLGQLHELTDRAIKELAVDYYLELNLKKHGNEYCEIVECDCATPEDHNDM
jgi:hypothetical protein